MKSNKRPSNVEGRVRAVGALPVSVLTFAVLVVVALIARAGVGAGAGGAAAPGEEPAASVEVGPNPFPTGVISPSQYPGDLAAAMSRWSWVTTTADGRWRASNLGTASTDAGTAADGSWAVVAWSRLATTQTTDTSWTASIADLSTGDTTRFGPFDRHSKTEGIYPTVTADGSKLLVNRWDRGWDGGVVAVDANGLTQIVPARGVTGPGARNALTWSPTGRTLVSSYCDFEKCDVDVIDPVAETATRLDAQFNVVAATDSALFGQLPNGSWALLSLTDGTAIKIDPSQIGQLSVAFSIDDRTFIADSQQLGHYDILAVDAVTGGTRLLYRDTEPDGPAYRLLLDRLPGSDWLVLGHGPSMTDVFFGAAGAPSAPILLVRTSDGTTIEGSVPVPAGG